MHPGAFQIFFTLILWHLLAISEALYIKYKIYLVIFPTHPPWPLMWPQGLVEFSWHHQSDQHWKQNKNHWPHPNNLLQIYMYIINVQHKYTLLSTTVRCVSANLWFKIIYSFQSTYINL